MVEEARELGREGEGPGGYWLGKGKDLAATQLDGEDAPWLVGEDTPWLDGEDATRLDEEAVWRGFCCCCFVFHCVSQVNS